MQYKYKQAREERCLSMVDLAEKLEVHPSTVANWESGRRQITADKLLQLAEVLDFNVDYLLGRDCAILPNTETVDKEALRAMHGQPVWTAAQGWMLINITKSAFVTKDLSLIMFDDVSDLIYTIPPALSFSLRGIGAPLRLDMLQVRDRLWVEPVTADTDLGAELRGWYYMHNGRLVENEYGNRFYLASYGAKWLAFDECLGD